MVKESPGGLVELLEADEVARALKVSARTLRRMRESGELPAVRVRGQIRYHPDTVGRYIEEQRRLAS